jgi:hypothetical protein
MNQGSEPQMEFATSEKYVAQVSDLQNFESTVGIRPNR